MKKQRKLYLRESRARYAYSCAICSSLIRRGTTYYRDEPFPMAQIRGEAEIRHLCLNCVLQTDSGDKVIKLGPFGALRSSQRPDLAVVQLVLPFGGEAIIHKTNVIIVDVTSALIDKILDDYDEIYKIGPVEFEYLVHDRICAMGMEAERVGHPFQKDGGIDIVFWPSRPFPIPFMGAIQLKHHRSPTTKTGPEAIREMAGVMSTQPFNVGLVVTNTSFTVDAQWYAKHHRGLIRLRDMSDLKRWIASNFTDDAEWREIPLVLELCPGVTLDLRERIFRRGPNV